MVVISVNGNDYKVKTSWDEVTAKEAIRVSKIEVPHSILTGEVTKADQIKNLPAYYGKVLEVLSNIPSDVIDKIQWSERTVFFNEYLKHFIVDLASMPDNIKPIEKFEFKGKTYYLPKNKTLGDNKIPYFFMDTMTFTESANFTMVAEDLKTGINDNFLIVIATLAKEKDEIYTEENTVNKSILFQDLPMSIVWGVFFCIIQRCNEFANSITSHLKKQLEKEIAS